MLTRVLRLWEVLNSKCFSLLKYETEGNCAQVKISAQRLAFHPKAFIHVQMPHKEAPRHPILCHFYSVLVFFSSLFSVPDTAKSDYSQRLLKHLFTTHTRFTTDPKLTHFVCFRSFFF